MFGVITPKRVLITGLFLSGGAWAQTTGPAPWWETSRTAVARPLDGRRKCGQPGHIVRLESGDFSRGCLLRPVPVSGLLPADHRGARLQALRAGRPSGSHR